MYQKIYPKPKKIISSDGKFVFGKEVTVKISKDFSKSASLPLMAEFWKNFTCGLGKINFIEENEPGEFLWTIGECGKNEFDESDEYCLCVGEKGISLKAKDDVGLLHGFYTLLQLISPLNLKSGEESFYINCTCVHDAPELDFRCFHFCFRGINLDEFQKYMRFVCFMKFSHIILEFNGNLKFDCLKELAWPDAYTKEQIAPIIEEARQMGVEIIPLFNCLGHASMAGLMDCKHVVLDQNPALALLFEPNGWSFCISNPDTLSLLRSAREELIELCGPGSYFHMGLDESIDFGTCDLCAPKDRGELLSSFVNDVAEEMRQIGRRTMVWADMLLERKRFDPGFKVKGQKDFFVANGSDENPTHKALDKIDRDVIMVDWQYYITDRPISTTDYIASKGFDVIPASWNNFDNMHLLAENVGKNNRFGYMSTEWGSMKKNADLAIYNADLAWNIMRTDEITSFRLEERFYAAANIQRKLMPVALTYEKAGWN